VAGVDDCALIAGCRRQSLAAMFPPFWRQAPEAPLRARATLLESGITISAAAAGRTAGSRAMRETLQEIRRAATGQPFSAALAAHPLPFRPLCAHSRGGGTPVT
jgi:hypothetical protein